MKKWRISNQQLKAQSDSGVSSSLGIGYHLYHLNRQWQHHQGLSSMAKCGARQPASAYDKYIQWLSPAWPNG